MNVNKDAKNGRPFVWLLLLLGVRFAFAQGLSGSDPESVSGGRYILANIPDYTSHLYYFPQHLDEVWGLFGEQDQTFLAIAKKGMGFFEAEGYGDARGSFLEGLALAKGLPATSASSLMNLLIAYTFLMEGNFDRAMAAFKSTGEVGREFLNENAEALKSDKALARHAEEVNTMSVVASFMENRLLQREGEVAEAFEGYQKIRTLIMALDKQASSEGRFRRIRLLETLYYRLGECALLLDRADEALKTFEVIAGQLKGSFFEMHAHYHRARSHEARGEVAEALKSFKLVRPESDLYVDSLLSQASLYQQAQSEAKAKSLYRKVVKQYERHERAAEAFFALGSSLHRSRQLSEAKRYLEPFVRGYYSFEDRLQALLILADIYQYQGQDSAFVDVLNNAVKTIDSEDEFAHMVKERIDLHVDSGRRNEAQKWLTALLQNEGLSASFRVELKTLYSDLLAELRDEPEPEEEVVSEDPIIAYKLKLRSASGSAEQSKISYELADLLYAKNQLKPAEGYYYKSFLYESESDLAMKALLQVARIKMEQSDSLGTELTIRKIFNVYPDKPVRIQAELELAKYYLRQGDNDAAIGLLKKIVALYPDSEEAKIAEGLLKKAN